MKNSLWLLSTAVALVLVTGSAHANVLSMDDIEDRLEEQGYDVDDVTIAGGVYEVTVESPDGTLLKWTVDPTSGEQLSEATSISEHDWDEEEEEDDEDDREEEEEEVEDEDEPEDEEENEHESEDEEDESEDEDSDDSDDESEDDESKDD